MTTPDDERRRQQDMQAALAQTPIRIQRAQRIPIIVHPEFVATERPCANEHRIEAGDGEHDPYLDQDSRGAEERDLS